MFSYDRVLPIGSVVLLEGAESRLMIVGYQRKSIVESDTMIYDYCGVPYPQGYLSPDKTAIFNHDKIDRIISIGLQNATYDKVAERIREMIAEREAQAGKDSIE